MFLLDSSGSVGSSNFNKMKDFVSSLVQEYDIGSNHVRVGVVSFSNTAHNNFDLNQYHNQTAMFVAIHNIQVKQVVP
jgi:collagen type VI alpha